MEKGENKPMDTNKYIEEQLRKLLGDLFKDEYVKEIEKMNEWRPYVISLDVRIHSFAKRVLRKGKDSE